MPMNPLFFTPEHQLLRESVRAFAKEHIAPGLDSWEEQGKLPRALYRAWGEAGFMGAGYPEEVGGSGGDVFHAIAVAEELSAASSAGVTAGLGSAGIALPPIVHAGTAEQKARFVAPTLAGEKIAALAITEPNAGSDVASIATRAVRDGDCYVVNGAKTFITSGCQADFLTAAVRTGGPGFGGISVLVIEAGGEGYRVARAIDKMGWAASDTAELVFEDLRVPVENLLGQEDQGFLILMQNFAHERLMLAVIAVQMAATAFDLARAHARQRKAFGKPLTGFQVTRHKLAQMATEIEVARSYNYLLAERLRRGESCLKEVAMAKTFSCDMACRVIDEALQLFGGYGYCREYPIERLYRDIRLFPIGGGTREIMREIISKQLDL